MNYIIIINYIITANTFAKRLRMRQVENFRSLFQSHFPVRFKVSRVFHSQNQRAKAGSMAFRSQNFHVMYLAAESFVFAWDGAEPLSLRLLKSSTKKTTME